MNSNTSSAISHFSQPSPLLKQSAENPPSSFDSHMSQWAEDFGKPLVKPSTNVEFEMPYCYSEEFYNKVSAKSFLMQPFGSIGEPMPSSSWNSQLDEWQEKSQMALQYYRQLCEQRSRLPSQTIVIKNSVAQFVANQCSMLGAEVFFNIQENGVRIGTNVVFDEKTSGKPTIYLMPEQDHDAVKPPDCPNNGVQIKIDAPIYTSSWQN